MTKSLSKLSPAYLVGLMMPSFLVGVTLPERRQHLLPDVVAIPYLLAYLILVPACVVCGLVIVSKAWIHPRTVVTMAVGKQGKGVMANKERERG